MDKETISRVRKFISREKLKLNQKIITFLFFLGLSFVFWLLNALNQNFSTNVIYPVKYSYQLPDKAMINEIPQEVNLNLSGHGYSLIKCMLSAKKHPIDLRVMSLNLIKIPSQDNKYYLLTKPLRDKIQRDLGSEVTVIDILPDTLYYNFSDIVRKKVPVKPILEIDFKKQFMLAGAAISAPDSVIVSGAKSIIDTIQLAKTEPLHFKNIDKPFTTEATIRIPDKVMINKRQVTLSVNVDKYTEATITVPIKVINLPDSLVLKTFPSTVIINYIVSLRNYNMVNQRLFRAVVDYHSVSSSINNKIKVTLENQPLFVSSVNYKPKSVDFIIEK